MEFTEAELRKAVIHLAFDVQHFRSYVALLKDTKLLKACPAARQAVIYALLLHLRLLLDFFYREPKQDDCCVTHFRILPGFSDFFPSQILSPTPADVEQVRINLHKRLAHLTATRWDRPAPPMEYYQQYFDRVDRLIDAFQAALPDDIRDLFSKELQKWDKGYSSRIRSSTPE